MPTIAPPVSDEVVQKSFTVRMQPSSYQDIEDLIKATKLTRAKVISMLINSGKAALAGNTPLIAQWQKYLAEVKAAPKA